MFRLCSAILGGAALLLVVAGPNVASAAPPTREAVTHDSPTGASVVARGVGAHTHDHDTASVDPHGLSDDEARLLFPGAARSDDVPREPRCYTPAVLSLAERRGEFAPALSARVEALLAGADAYATSTPESFELGRPRSAGSVVSTSLPIRVHHRTRAGASLAKTVLRYAEESWRAEVAMGFYPPLPDDGKGGGPELDLYLTTEQRSGGGAYTSVTYDDADPGDDIRSCQAYIALYEGLDPDIEMPVFVAHELNHAFQAAMDYTEHRFFWEATATAVEDLVYDDINDYYSFLDDFQVRPHYAINRADGIYPYGAALFTQFLDTWLGDEDGTLLAEMWRRTGQPGEANEPDYLDVIDDIAYEAGVPGMGALFPTFTGWRYFAASLDDGAHLEEAGAWPSNTTVSLASSLKAEALPTAPLTPQADPPLAPADLGANYHRIDTSQRPSSTLVVALQGDPTAEWALTVIRWYDDRDGEIVVHREGGGGKVNVQVPINGADHVTLAPVNLGQDGFDAEDDGLPVSYSLTVSLR